MRNLPRWQQILRQGLLALVGLYVLIPIWSMLRLAFDGDLRGRPTEFRLFPARFSLEPLLKVLDRPYQTVEFTTLLQNSLMVTLGAAALSIVLGASLAYAFARFRFPGRQAGLFTILLTAVLPPVAFMTPLYIVLSSLGIRANLFGLVIVYAAFAMPFCIWNMRAAFQSVPREVEEAAFLDGANHLTTFAYITLPLALPSIAVAALIAFLMAYSEFTLGWLFVDRASNVTLSMAVYSIVQTGSAQPWSQLASLALLISAPVVVIFIIFQNTIFERFAFGSTGD